MSGFTFLGIGPLLVPSHFHFWKIFTSYSLYLRFMTEKKKKEKKRNSRLWGWMIIAGCKGLFLLFYLVIITWKVACTPIHIWDNIHRIRISGMSSWHKKWREGTLTNPSFPLRAGRGVSYRFFRSLSDNKFKARCVCPRPGVLSEICIILFAQKVNRKNWLIGCDSKDVWPP